MIANIMLSILLQAEVAMADALREDGKFWVVVCVITTVTVGIMIYLFVLDKKIRNLEKK